MTYQRVQKLLHYREYNEFKDEEILVESSFAQITSYEEGIRSVLLGNFKLILINSNEPMTTPFTAMSKRNLFIAADKFLMNGDIESSKFCHEYPEIETLELVSIFPLSHIKFRMVCRRASCYLSFSCKKHPEKNMLFEFGGHLMRSLFWNIWLDRIYKLEGFYLNKTDSSENQSVHEIFRAECEEAEDSDFPFLRSCGSETSLQEAQFYPIQIAKIIY